MRALLNCPFCSATMIDHDGTEFEHPENDCFLSEWNFACDAEEWNRRTEPKNDTKGKL